MINSKVIIPFFSLILLIACESDQKNDEKIPIEEENKGKQELNHYENENVLSLSTDEISWDFGNEVVEKVWTYNGTIPGEEIRVTEGETVRVNLKNNLDEPVSIHWHGVLLPNEMDGVAGITQNAVKKGETFTYEFEANKPGTFWYHSHQSSARHVDKGLYGAFIVEPKELTYDKDFVLMLDEWLLQTNQYPTQSDIDVNNANPELVMDYGEMDTEMLYNTFSVNGKRYPNIEPLNVQYGEVNRLRIINAGFMKHRLDFSNQPYKIVASDANDILNPTLTTDILEIAPGERIDVEFIVKENMPNWYIQSADYDFAATDMRIPVIVDNKKIDAPPTNINYSKDIIKPTEYEGMKPLFSEQVESTVNYEMSLGVKMGMGQGMVFTINNATFPNTNPIFVNEDDIVKVTIKNNSRLDHPMHLHGHDFQVIAKNGVPLSNPLVKDLINIQPEDEYTIIFKADAPGNWAFHCHDLLHASRGMMTTVNYKGSSNNFNLGEGNMPE